MRVFSNQLEYVMNSECENTLSNTHSCEVRQLDNSIQKVVKQGRGLTAEEVMNGRLMMYVDLFFDSPRRE